MMLLLPQAASHKQAAEKQFQSTADGHRSFRNEFIFDDDERLGGNVRENSVRNQLIISYPEKAIPRFSATF